MDTLDDGAAKALEGAIKTRRLTTNVLLEKFSEFIGFFDSGRTGPSANAAYPFSLHGFGQIKNSTT